MAFKISGKIVSIGDIEQIPYQGNVFKKRELVLDCSKRNQFTGEVEFPNYPKFEFTGNHVDDLNGYESGQIVTVSFDLSGRRVDKGGKISYFTNVQGFKIELYQSRTNQSQAQSQQSQAANTTSSSNQPQGGDNVSHSNQAQSSEAFPPACDENGNPIKGENDDLPF